LLRTFVVDGDGAGAGRRVPADVSVVGHNDMPVVDMVAPPLTTVRIGHAAMGREAALLLLRALEGEGGGSRGAAAVLPRPELVVRGSTAAPAPAEGSAWAVLR
jgi:LacI family transcriptional regulator